MKLFWNTILPGIIILVIGFFLGVYLAPSLDVSAEDHADLQKLKPSLQDTGKVKNLSSSKNSVVSWQTPAQPQDPLPSVQPTPMMPPNLQRIMQGGDIVERLGTYLDAVRSMDRSNVDMVVKAFEELPGGYGRHLEMKLLMRSWANFDPEGALTYASKSLDAKSERRFGISEALAGWAVKDQKAAIAWAEANHPGNENSDNPLLVGIVKGLIENDLDAANRLFLNLPKGSARWQSSSLLAEKYAEQGVQQGMQWAESYPEDDPRMRETILGQMGARLARQDLEATASWAKQMEDEPGAYRVLENLIHQWANQDPLSASSWVNDLAEPKKRMHAMKELSGRWAVIDPAATADWLNSQPPSAQVDPAIATFVSRIQGMDPAGAAGWATSISDPLLREQSLKKALNAWQQTDPEQANQWIEQNGIKDN